MNMKVTNSLKVHMVMHIELQEAVKRFITFIGKAQVEFTTSEEADVIIFEEVRDVVSKYNEEQNFVYLKSPGANVPVHLPKNCETIDTMQMVTLTDHLDKIHQKLEPVAVTPVVKSPKRSNPNLRILVIDDSPRNIASAKAGLDGYKLTTARGYDEAMKILSSEEFDVVLTDLELQMSMHLLCDMHIKLGELVPYGMLIAIEAAHRGAKYVAIVTNGGHHKGPLQAAFDYFSGFPVKIENAKVKMMHAYLEGSSKKWETALTDLMEEEN